MPHGANWICGWCLTLAAFVSGAGIGLLFTRENFLGGYGAWPRRMVRLGHIALAALGLFNIVYGIAPLPRHGTWQAAGASWGLMLGGIAMPLICFLSAWRVQFRKLFFLPVTALIAATVFILIG
jgi:hypothetical protein